MYIMSSRKSRAIFWRKVGNNKTDHALHCCGHPLFQRDGKIVIFCECFFLFYSKRFFRRVFVHDEALSPTENVLCQFPYSIGLCFCCCVYILFLIRPLSTIDFPLCLPLFVVSCICIAPMNLSVNDVMPYSYFVTVLNTGWLTSPWAYNRLSFSTFFFVSWCFSKVILENEWVTFCSQIGCLARRLNYLSEMEMRV